MELSTIILIVWLHYFADFLLQLRILAENKSSGYKFLSIHVAIYTLVFMLVFGPVYALLNGALHFVVDFVSSRCTTYFYKQKDWYKFFGVVGADQALHFTCLFGTYVWLFGPA